MWEEFKIVSGKVALGRPCMLGLSKTVCLPLNPNDLYPLNTNTTQKCTELGAPDACLIPCSNKKPITDKPKEGVPKKDEKFFIRSMRMEKEVFLNVTITTMDTHD
jgi:hypothetical protein